MNRIRFTAKYELILRAVPLVVDALLVAEAELGERFDIREFHDQVLDTGSLPLPVLENKIDAWIAAKRV